MVCHESNASDQQHFFNGLEFMPVAQEFGNIGWFAQSFP
jgi:hypothetical protein